MSKALGKPLAAMGRDHGASSRAGKRGAREFRVAHASDDQFTRALRCVQWPLTPHTARKLAYLARAAMDRQLETVPRDYSRPCGGERRACGYGPCIAVTPLEALAIAEDLNDRYDRKELSVLRARLVELSERYAGLSVSQQCESLLPCGLLGSVGQECVAYSARPLACAGAYCRRGARADAVHGEPHYSRRHDGPALIPNTYPTGIAEAIRSKLSSGGLDMKLYELNSAVLRALNCPDAMARWLRGDPLFHGCLAMATDDPARVGEPVRPVAAHGPHVLLQPTRPRLVRQREEGGGNA